MSEASRASTPTVDRPPIHFYYPLGDPKGVVAEQVVNVFSREKHRPGNYNWTVKTGHIDARRIRLQADGHTARG